MEFCIEITKTKKYYNQMQIEKHKILLLSDTPFTLHDPLYFSWRETNIHDNTQTSPTDVDCQSQVCGPW